MKSDEAEITGHMPTYSILIPIYNEEENIHELYGRLTNVMEKLSINEKTSSDSYEIIMVDDGSTDSSWQLIKELHDTDSRVKGLSFSRNFGHHPAIAAGFDNASGKILIIMDADLQAQPEDIPKAVKKIKEGCNIVWAISEKRKDSLMVRLGAKIFYFIMNKLTSVKMPENTVFICMDKLAADAIKLFKEKRRLPGGIWSDVGFNKGTVMVEKKERHIGKAKYTFLKRLKVIVIGVVTYSKLPLRFVTSIGLIMAVSSFMIGLLIIIRKLFYDIQTSGYASIIVAITLLSGVQLISLGIIAEYIGIVFDEVKNRPIYLIKEICK